MSQAWAALGADPSSSEFERTVDFAGSGEGIANINRANLDFGLTLDTAEWTLSLDLLVHP